MAIANNTVRFNGGNEVIKRYEDLFKPEIKDEREEMTTDEFVDDIWSKIKG